ncbi:unnamed protein product [Eruca vesicaria subsp. sativa]|uniref:Uncharacterized protein n=1 Tax=Eruca vesicaria subsp. sativa TaxID=29727 RepID=A0ABC8J497_ERUVS|nr:unnamed protein product [Eruca vesicaria subsp. sativa]
MEPTSFIDDAEFWLPPEFLSDDDFTVEKESFLAGLSRKMVQSSLEDDFSGAKAWSKTARSPQSIPRVSSQAVEAEAWDMYFAAAEELSMMNLNGYNNLNNGRGLLDLPRKHPNDGSGFYSRQSLQYQKLQAIHVNQITYLSEYLLEHLNFFFFLGADFFFFCVQFQQLKQQQLMKHHRQLAQQRVNNNHIKGSGHVDLAPSAWPQRRSVFLGDRTGKRGSTGTGVFLPRSVNQTSPVTAETRQKHTLGTVLVPARVAQVLNLHESMGHQPAVRSSASLNDVSWRQRSNNGGYSSQMKIEHAVSEPRLPSEWAY